MQAELTLTNYPTTGPIFSGPHQESLRLQDDPGAGSASRSSTTSRAMASGCRTRRQHPPAGASTARLRTRGSTTSTAPPAGSFAAASRRRLASGEHERRRPCSTAAPSTTSCAASAARSTASSTRSRCSRRSARSPATDPDTSLWNKRLIYTFDGGVAIGRNQGTPGRQRPVRHRPEQGLRDRALDRHAHEHPLQPRARRRDRADDEGGVRRALRGAALHGRRRRLRRRRSSSTSTGRTTRSLLDAGIPQYSYPDMVTQTIHVGDCELLEQLHGRDRRRPTRSGRTGTTASGSRA